LLLLVAAAADVASLFLPLLLLPSVSLALLED
jgi:hypothetical protein